jgi:hypothetical protein
MNGLVLVAGVAVGLAVLVGLGFLWYLPIKVSAERRHSKSDGIFILTLVSLIVWPLWIVAMIWAVSEDNRVASRGGRFPSPRPVMDDEVTAWARNRDEPGEYQVAGVDVATKTPRTVRVNASGRAEAKRLAEDMGLLFTDKDIQFVA